MYMYVHAIDHAVILDAYDAKTVGIQWGWAMQFWGITVSSFSPLKSLCKFLGKRYGRSMSRADFTLKIQATKFNLEDDEKQQLLFQCSPARLALLCL